MQYYILRWLRAPQIEICVSRYVALGTERVRHKSAETDQPDTATLLCWSREADVVSKCELHYMYMFYLMLLTAGVLMVHNMKLIEKTGD